MVPRLRISAVNAAPVREGRYVLYWMIAARRTSSNVALQRAVEHAVALGKPLLVFEPLRVDHAWASVRSHQFVLDGMRDNAAAFKKAGVAYFPYLERRPGEARGLLQALAADATVIVTDDFPCFFLPRMVAAAARSVPVLLEAVDSNGLLPLRATDRVYPTAHAFRRALQKILPEHLAERPVEEPLSVLPRQPEVTIAEPVTERWPHALEWLKQSRLETLPIDGSVLPLNIRGGSIAAHERLRQFLDEDFDRYGVERNHPDRDVSSRLSPYLHWGHLSVHQVFAAVMEREGWLGDLPRAATGSKAGWWGTSAAADSFLDELITWRELGFNMTAKQPDYDTFESLPRWSIETLTDHEDDGRDSVYALDELEQGRTHDALWNAAQRQLVTEGRIHSYLRMLWGKKILEWTAGPRQALAAMIELNNKYAIDGRDPNSYSGIFWVLGRYDRPWHPERPIFGTVRYMSSENTARKMRVREYLKRFSAAV